MIKFPEHLGLEKLLDAGGDITITSDPEDRTIYFDLNTGMKSHLRLFLYDGMWLAATRYNSPVPVNTWEQVVLRALDCLCGRDYMSEAWKKIFIEFEYIKVEKKVVEKIIHL